MSNERLADVAALSANGSVQAITLLVLMLERRGVLEKGAYAQALKNTFNAPDADYQRFDYSMLRHLATVLDTASGLMKF